MTTETKRREQPRSVETRERLVEAALHEFAEMGYGGASTRSIASRAGVAQSAVPYHFKTKEALWKASANHLFGWMRSQFQTRITGLKGVDVATRARLLLRDFVLFAAAHPELHRFMLQEGTSSSARLEWLVETHVRPGLAVMMSVIAELEEAGTPFSGRPEHIHYMMIGAASMPYAVGPEFKLATGKDPFDKDLIESHADSVLALFFPDSKESA